MSLHNGSSESQLHTLSDETGEFRRDVAIGTMPAPCIFGLEV